MKHIPKKIKPFKKLVEPTWQDLLPWIISLLVKGNKTGKLTASRALTKMAQRADAYVTIANKKKHNLN